MINFHGALRKNAAISKGIHIRRVLMFVSSYFADLFFEIKAPSFRIVFILFGYRVRLYSYLSRIVSAVIIYNYFIFSAELSINPASMRCWISSCSALEFSMK